MDGILKTLAQANASQRVDLDWQAQNQVATRLFQILQRPSFDISVWMLPFFQQLMRGLQA